MSDRVTLLVTGKFREPDVFRRMMTQWCAADSPVEEIIISTWDADISLFRSFFANLYGSFACPPIRYISNTEPLLTFPQPRTLVHQNHTLLNGLLACPDGLVLKTRTDFAVELSILPVLLDTASQKTQGPLKEFDYKLWVPWVDYEEPFHVADEAIFGTKSDLLRLCSRGINELTEFGFPLVHQHTILFTPDYTVTGRIFRDFLRAQQITGIFRHNESPQKFQLINHLLAFPEYQSVIGVYHRYLTANFRIDSQRGAICFKPSVAGAYGEYYNDRQLDGETAPRLFDKKFAGFGNHFYAWTQESLDLLIANACRLPEFAHYRNAYRNPEEIVAIHDERLLAGLVAAFAQWEEK